MAEGRIKWYSHHLGHGFILYEDSLGDVFVRSEDITGDDPWSLSTGDKVTFEVVDAPEGKEARTVSKVS
jgi:CspA family cold shock protein